LLLCCSALLVLDHRDPNTIMATSMVDSVALVTAGSAGLGAATVRAFAALQMRVVINYHSDTQRANNLVKELEEMSRAARHGHSSSNNGGGGSKRFLAIQADVASRADLIRLVETTVAQMGRLDVVFSNAGWTRLTDFRDLDVNVEDADWDRCFNMNVKSHLYLLHAAREHLKASKGSFITTGSTAGVKPGAGSSLVRLGWFKPKGAGEGKEGGTDSPPSKPLLISKMGSQHNRPANFSAGIRCDESSTDPPRQVPRRDCKPRNPCELRLPKHADDGIYTPSLPPSPLIWSLSQKRTQTVSQTLTLSLSA
jgi:NAD(P)-dependent dehydrogenase (short-subunit alcohol dehydrogenase family)